MNERKVLYSMMRLMDYDMTESSNSKRMQISCDAYQVEAYNFSHTDQDVSIFKERHAMKFSRFNGTRRINVCSVLWTVCKVN
jgi:hypothetical protein